MTISLKLSAMTMIVTGALATQRASTPSWPGFGDLTSQVCVDRPENLGLLNVSESVVVIDKGPALILIGGQAACAYVAPGPHQMWVQSPDPYHPDPSKPQAWKSETMSFATRKAERIEFDVCGADRGNGYVNWRIQKPGPKCE